MIVFFDKENYINYLKNSTTSDIGRDTLRMIKKQLNVHLNFNIDDLEEFEFLLHGEFQEGVAPEFKLTSGDNKVNRPLKKDSFPLQNGIYLLNEDIRNVKNLHSVLIGTINQEIETLEKLIIEKDYQFHYEKNIGVDIKPDCHLNILDFPFSTLVVIDRYIFKGPEIGGNLGLYEFNLDKILKNIFLNKQGPALLIFIYQINVKEPNTSPRYDEGPDISKLSNKIKKVVSRHCPAPVLCFIGVPAGFIDDEHDRYILSNYLRIKSGDSLVYFDSTGKINTDSKSVDFYSLALRHNREINENLVNKINNIVKETLEKHPRFSNVPAGTNSNEIINFK